MQIAYYLQFVILILFNIGNLLFCIFIEYVINNSNKFSRHCASVIVCCVYKIMDCVLFSGK